MEIPLHFKSRCFLRRTPILYRLVPEEAFLITTNTNATWIEIRRNIKV
jgi:hypothetical protein